MTVRPDSPRNSQCLVTGTSRDVQHPATINHAGQVKHQLGRGSKPLAQKHSPIIPSLSRSLPLLPSSLLELHRIESRAQDRKQSPSKSGSYLNTLGVV